MTGVEQIASELADRLDAEEGHPDGGDITLADLRAAATELRRLTAERDALAARLDSIIDAIGDPNELRWHRWHCDATGSGDDLRELLVRIADAADAARGEAPTEARPETCPTCGSDDPAVRIRVRRPEVHIEGGSRSCRFCNRTLTFNFMRNDGGDCTCRQAQLDGLCTGPFHATEARDEETPNGE